MKKVGLIIGSVMIIAAVIIGAVCLLLPTLTNNRVKFGETAFGFIPAGILLFAGTAFLVVSVIINSIIGKKLAAYKAQLETTEGILLINESARGSITYRNFRRPGLYSSWRKVLVTAFLTLTKNRLLALNGTKPLIDVALTDERLRQMNFSLEGEKTLLVAFNANLFQSDWSGEIEYRFKTEQAAEYLKLLNEMAK